MIRLLIFFVLLAVLAYGGMLLVQHPGHVDMNWFGYEVRTSAALLVIAVAVAAIVVWVVFRIIVGLPSFVRLAARQRRREKGYAALSRGLVAVGAGDARGATRASAQASRHLGDDSLALMLEAQAAHLGGNVGGAVRAFQNLAQREETRILGLRGLFAEASRRGDDEAARHFAAAAHKAAPLPWSAQAVLEHRAGASDWEEALATVETSVAGKLVDKETGERQRAVLETAIAYDKEGTAPDAALALARAAIRRAPDLAPPIVLAAHLLSRRGDIRKAAKLIEKAWPQCQHPDIAQAYLDVRPGDSTTDRLARAKTLMGISSFDPVSRVAVARAALANTDYAAARAAMAPLVGEGKRPTVRMCLLMAEVEEAEYGDIGQWREWLARASRASLDPAWVADGIVYDHWSPVSPTSGKLDAFRWQVPAERLGPAMEAMPALRPREPALTSSSTGTASLLKLGPAPTEPDIGAPAAAELSMTPPNPHGAAASPSSDAHPDATRRASGRTIASASRSPEPADSAGVSASSEPVLLLDSDAAPEVDRAAHELRSQRAHSQINGSGEGASEASDAPLQPPAPGRSRRPSTYHSG